MFEKLNNDSHIGFEQNKSKVQKLARLSKREIKVLHEIYNSSITPEIADKLYISINTVETHRRSIIKKPKVKNMMHALSIAFRGNLII